MLIYMMYDMRHAIQLESIHLVIYKLSISLQILCIIHVGIYHFDNNGDNYPSSLDFLRSLRPQEQLSNIKTPCTAKACRHVYIH